MDGVVLRREHALVVLHDFCYFTFFKKKFKLHWELKAMISVDTDLLISGACINNLFCSLPFERNEFLSPAQVPGK